MERQLWGILEQYQDVFAWNKGELRCCNVGEHIIDTQGFPPCKVAPGRLSYWEEAEVNPQINVLVELGKMRPSNSTYTCRVTLLVKKDGSRRSCGGLQTPQFTNSEGFIPYALSRRCNLAIRKVSMVHCVGFAIGILADQDGS